MKKTEIQDSVKKLVQECTTLNVRLINKLPLDLHFLIWSSPTSVRNPELSILWHPLHSKRRIFARLAAYFVITASSIVYGLYKFFKYRGFYYYQIKNHSPILLVIPENITEQSNEYKTNYLIEKEGYPVDKLLFSYSKKRLKNGSCFSTLSYFIKANLFFKMLLALFDDLREQLSNKKVTWEYIDALMILVCWIYGQTWNFVWDFYQLINKYGIAKCNKYLLVLHEMHFYSNVVWKVANEKGLPGIAVQHGMIITEKMWYFPDESEIRVGRPLPDIFFVYSDEIKELLQPIYSKTKFMKCCSPRFRHWKSTLSSLEKDVKKSDSNGGNAKFLSGKNNNEGKVVLIVNNAAIVHDVVVIKALRRLVRQNLNGCFIFRFRPHPTERLGLRYQLWIEMAVMLRRIEKSSKSLREDFKEADLVIGANSTVVQEALLLRVPVMGVTDDNYIASSILPSSFICKHDKITGEVLKHFMIKKPDEDLVHRFKANIGMFSPDLTTELIYKLGNIS